MLGACKDNLKYRITFKWRIGRQKRARSCFSEVLFMSKSFASRISRELREEKWASGRRNNKKKTIEIWVTMARNLWSLGSGCMFAGWDGSIGTFREWEHSRVPEMKPSQYGSGKTRDANWPWRRRLAVIWIDKKKGKKKWTVILPDWN